MWIWLENDHLGAPEYLLVGLLAVLPLIAINR
jgi:hypothetical protein